MTTEHGISSGKLAANTGKAKAIARTVSGKERSIPPYRFGVTLRTGVGKYEIAD